MSGQEQEPPEYRRALAFATAKHAGQLRKDGVPYIMHPIAVSRMVKDGGFPLSYQICGLFHDLLEDTDASEQEILALGGQDVLTAVKLLTKTKGYKMADYIAGIRGNEMACAVKAADRLHNLQCALKTDAEFKRKYILETIDWYMDFSPEIPKAVRTLAESLDAPMVELPLLYEPIKSWKK